MRPDITVHTVVENAAIMRGLHKHAIEDALAAADDSVRSSTVMREELSHMDRTNLTQLAGC